MLQFHYIKWPDYGTPKLAAPLLNFLRMVHESNASEERTGPMVVHCRYVGWSVMYVRSKPLICLFLFLTFLSLPPSPPQCGGGKIRHSPNHRLLPPTTPKRRHGRCLQVCMQHERAAKLHGPNRPAIQLHSLRNPRSHHIWRYLV